MRTPKDILDRIQNEGIKVVNLRFVDLPGDWQHFSIPASYLTEERFETGIPFDGSSIHGFQPIHKSDLLMMPDAKTDFIDPFMDEKTLTLICNIAYPTRMPYLYDPRFVAQKAEEYLSKSHIADTAYFGPEAEFYIFDAVHYTSSANIQYAEVESAEASWNSASRDERSKLGHFLKPKGGYLPVPPHDSLQDLRTKMMLTLETLGIPVEGHHHEVGAPGQAEIRFQCSMLVETADRLLLYKYVAKNVAYKQEKSVTFMPKPVLGDNGSGMHTHQSLWKDRQPLFHDSGGYAGLSQLAHYYIGGILMHTPALLAIAAPSTNSYKRLVPGYEAPVNLAYAQGNRSAAVRIPLTDQPHAKRIEYRPPDPMANPYLLFSALLLAGLDGIQQRTDPRSRGYGPFDEDLYSQPAGLPLIGSIPCSLEESLNALEKELEKNDSFLWKGEVFRRELIEKYIEIKRNEVDQVRLCPAPIEFSLYYSR
jgi:glutamine synthetase